MPLRPRRSGFSLVEVVIAAVVMLLASIGGTRLFTQATVRTGDIQEQLDQQLAISRDLAAILVLNETYSCRNLSATQTDCAATLPSAGTPPPDQNGYAPDDPDNPDHTPSFRALCNQGLLGGLIGDDTPTTIGAATLTTQTGVGNRQRTLSLKRSVRLLEPAGSSDGDASLPPHRYLVTWSDTADRVLRQVQLIPTVAAWCP